MRKGPTPESTGRSVVAADTKQLPYLRDPDVQLMMRVQQGDDEAFTQLVAAYQDRLVAVFQHVLKEQTHAEDLAQEVFLRVYRARERYVPTAKFSTWLFRIANNLASNSRRSKGRRKEVQLNVRDSGPLGPRPAEQLVADKSAMMPGRQLDKREMCDIVREALDTLSERQRMALLLHRFEGMSYANIAVSMNMTPTAVKSLLSRARDNLKQRLESYVK